MRLLKIENNYYSALALAIITIAVISAVFGWYYEELEKMAAVLAYGDISTPPYHIWVHESLLFLIPLITHAADYFNKLPVYGLWHLFIIVVFTSLWFHLYLRVLGRLIKNSTLQVLLISCLFVWPVIGMCLVYVNLTRSSILLTSGSLLLYLDYFLFDNKKSIPLILSFLLGCLVRLTTGVLVLIVISIFILFYFRDFKKMVTLLKYQWGVVIMGFLILQIYSHVYRNPGAEMQQYSEFALKRGMVVPLSVMKSKGDSIRYMAVTEHSLFSDSAQITPAFMKYIVERDKFMNWMITKEDFNCLSAGISSSINKYKYQLILLYLLLFVGTWNSTYKTMVDLIGTNVFGWLLLLVLALKINMSDRFLLPWVSMLASCSFILLALQKVKFRNWQKISILALLVITNIAVVLKMSNISSIEKESNRKTYSYLNRVGAVSERAIPVIWDTGVEYFPSDIFSRSEANVLKKCLFQSMAFSTYNEFAQERWLSEFGFSPLNWKVMNIKLKNNRDKIRFITDEKTADFIGLYYHVIYNMDFKLVQDKPAFKITEGDFYTENPSPVNFAFQLAGN